jgi:GTP-binding protein
LQRAILIETMRREGYEFQVGRPQVIVRHEGGKKLEPIEQAVVDVPAEYAGKVIEIFGSRGGEMTDMVQRDEHVHLEFKIATRGVMGLRTRILNATRGEATLFHHFFEYGPYRGDIGGRINGSLIAMSTDKSVAFALDALQTRGKMFIGPGEMCYEGMIVGEHAKDNDLVVNVAKAKQLTNMRAASADKGIQLAPPITFTLEEALEYIEDDELVEVPPQSIRLRKRLLSENDRKKSRRS